MSSCICCCNFPPLLSLIPLYPSSYFILPYQYYSYQYYKPEKTRILSSTSIINHGLSQLPPSKRLPLPLPSCVSRSLNATLFVVAFTTVMPLMPALPTVVVAITSRHRRSWLATRVRDTQLTAPARDPLANTIIPTLAMLAAALADAMPTEVFVGDESSTFWTAWRFWRTTQFGNANQTGNVERRRQRGSTSVLGGASPLP